MSFDSITKKFSIILIILLFFSVFLPAEIVFSATEWVLGVIEPDQVFLKSMTIENRGNALIKLSLLSTCECLSAAPQEFILEPHSSAQSELSFDSSDDSGDFEKIIIIRSTDPGLPKAFFTVSGRVEGLTDEFQDPLEMKGSDSEEYLLETSSIDADYYYSSDCRSCREFIEKGIPELELKLGVGIKLNKKDIHDPEVFEELDKRLAVMGIKNQAFPVFFYNDQVLQGGGEIENRIESLLKGEWTPENIDRSRTSDNKLKLIPVILAGLLDGINPCAFTTLIFLITALAVAGKNKREILIIGIFFTFSVYFTYYFIGLGFFSVIRMADTFVVVSVIIRWVLFSVLMVFAVLSFYDYIKIKMNQTSEILLQLPKGIKRKIHTSVRIYTRNTAIIGSSLILGFLVSVFELGCTGQIYFPTITYMIRTGAGFSGYLMLGVYNLAFIIPLCMVFFVTYKGVGSEKITSLFQKYLGKVKLGTAILFVILGIITLIN